MNNFIQGQDDNQTFNLDDSKHGVECYLQLKMRFRVCPRTQVFNSVNIIYYDL